MTDNRTTELLPCPFCGGEASKRLFYGARYGVYCDECDARVGGLFLTEAEAIAAWNARAERGTLTAEQVRKAIFNGSSYASYDGAKYYADGINMQAIADELNAELGGGNCARCAEDMGRYADSLCDPLKERIAELLRCLENDWHIHASWDGLRKFWCIELTEEGVKLRDAARAERTCHNTRENRWFKCSACGYGFTDLYAEDESDINEQPRYCPNCGAKAVDA